MNKVILYNPSITTLNIGDEIIFESVYKNIQPLLEEAFVINVSTHLPVSAVFADLLRTAYYKFVCGTNLLRNLLERRFRQWDINCFNVKKLSPCILIGVGWQQDRFPFTPYTKNLYRTILSHETIHSVRDEYTKKRLESIGITNVINTGCATMWELTKKKCSTIPKTKQRNVVFTLTDYKPDPQKDSEIINILCTEYEYVYLWIQGSEDYTYAKKLDVLDRVKIVSPSLKSYDHLLNDTELDYVGTRLHGGIRALQHGKRTMIIAVDGRATEKKKDFNLPVVTREELTADTLTDIIHAERKTEIVIPENNIREWKKQFGLA
jgi:polysaccharide pyruvyl transferase WcaK-like protein